MLSPQQLREREGKLTASRVSCLMTGDEAAILALWRELCGGESEERDLSDVWPVRLGETTEQLSLDWFDRKHGPVTRRGEVVIGKFDWMAATLDGWSDLHGCPVECKHVGGRESFDVIRERYFAQMTWQMLCTEASQCALSVIMGANEPVVEYVDKDDAYASELMMRAEAFWLCVQNLTPPCAVPAVAAPVKPERIYDMQGSNTWAANAATWLTTKTAAKDFTAAEKELKTLVPTDAAKCVGHGITINRDRAGRLSIREQK
jgi:hypothetical protein